MSFAELKNRFFSGKRKMMIPLLVVSHVMMLSLGYCFKKGETIEQIGGHKITDEEFQEQYKISIEKLARLQNVEKTTLSKLLCQAPVNPRRQPEVALIQNQLNPALNYKQYRDWRMVEQIAAESGFLKRPVIKGIIEQIVLDAVSRLYVQEQMEKRIKITEDMKEKECLRLRTKFPKMKNVPLDDCMRIAFGRLKRQQIKRELDKLIDEMRETIVIKPNKEFDKKDFLKNKISLYQTLRKKGGCEAPPAGDKKEDKTTDNKGDKK